ncbi:MAG: Branched-chain amino acid ATP-binding cassette transporter, partial [Solirubrobacteraceae bacterium]|nr:Branched-chain amino acid ATP-binding cassette transporter [Solirubrobacteraceae bacterium]
LLAQGPPTKIQQDEAVVDAYFGRAEAHA